jgi:glutathione S-transferase
MPIAEHAEITFFYAPRTRSFRTLWFLEELGRPYRIELVDYAKGAHKRPEFLKINPMGKVPVVVDQGMPIAETGAIFTQLADKYSPDELAPLIKDPRRPDYLRWLFFAAGVMEPAFCEKYFKWEIPAHRVAWGSFDTMQEAVIDGVNAGAPWLTGEQFTAADILVGSNLHFGMFTSLFPSEGPIAKYVAKCAERPALKRALRIEEDYVAATVGSAR